MRWRNYDDISRFDTTPERNRRTERTAISLSRVSIAVQMRDNKIRGHVIQYIHCVHDPKEWNGKQKPMPRGNST